MKVEDRDEAILSQGHHILQEDQRLGDGTAAVQRSRHRYSIRRQSHLVDLKPEEWTQGPAHLSPENEEMETVSNGITGLAMPEYPKTRQVRKCRDLHVLGQVGLSGHHRQRQQF